MPGGSSAPWHLRAPGCMRDRTSNRDAVAATLATRRHVDHELSGSTRRRAAGCGTNTCRHICGPHRPENRGPQLGARQRRRSRLLCPPVMWSAVGLGGLGDGDGVAEGFELADVVAGLAALVGSGLVVAGSELVVAGGGVAEQVPDDGQDGAGDGDLGAGGATAAGDAPVAFAEEGVGAGGGYGGLAQVAAQPGVALAFAVAGSGAGLDGAATQPGPGCRVAR